MDPSYPNQMETRLFFEVEKALKAGVREVLLCLAGAGFRRRKIVAMHLVGDQVLFFAPLYNPACDYGLELGKSGAAVEADDVLPARTLAGAGPRRGRLLGGPAVPVSAAQGSSAGWLNAIGTTR